MSGFDESGIRVPADIGRVGGAFSPARNPSFAPGSANPTDGPIWRIPPRLVRSGRSRHPPPPRFVGDWPRSMLAPPGPRACVASMTSIRAQRVSNTTAIANLSWIDLRARPFEAYPAIEVRPARRPRRTDRHPAPMRSELDAERNRSRLG